MSIVYGVGVNDSLIPVKINGKFIDSYSTWKGMLRRCYSKKLHDVSPTYANCVVCDDWKYFTNFKRWFDDNHIEGFELDKDLLVAGNKEYSPDKCFFVPRSINSLFNTNKKRRGSLPQGVSFYKRNKSNQYTAQISIMGKVKFLGRFKTPVDAMKAYDKEKVKAINLTLDKYGSQIDNTLLKELRSRFKPLEI